jgi:hypothetical protein
MKRLLPLLLLSLLMGQDCEPPPPPPNAYCEGSVIGDPGVLDSLWEGVEEIYNSILKGTPSTDRRSTMYLRMPGTGGCTAVVIGPHTALTAAHCKGDQGHQLKLKAGDSEYWLATGYLVHPEYLKYLGSGNVYREGRKADIMLLYFDDYILPEPYAGDIYSSDLKVHCSGLTAQGWGRTETSPEPCLEGESKCLREGPYVVTREDERQLLTRHAEDTPKICFGDSGGPLYATVAGDLYLAGITSTTSSMDCLVASHHTKVSEFSDWILANAEPTP